MRTIVVFVLLCLSTTSYAQEVYIPSLNMKVTLDVLQFKIDENEPQAMYMMGLCYDEGQGIKKDYALAFHWYRKSAKLGLPEGMRQTATCYIVGKGTKQSDEKAHAWMLRAAKAEDMQAILCLILMYQDGWCVDKADPAKAKYWAEKASALGYSEAKNMLNDTTNN